MRARPLRLLAILLVLCSPLGHAHLLKVFAFTAGDTLQGNSYFAGGAPASGAQIELQAADGSLITRLRPDAGGEFRYRLGPQRAARVIAATGDGHRAEWRLPDDEPIGSATHPALAADPSAIAATDPSALVALVEAAVARQVGPLRQELQASQARAKLADIIGGIGFIFGLAGVLLWWRSRAVDPKKDPGHGRPQTDE